MHSGQPPAIPYPPVTAVRPRPPARVSEPGPSSAPKPKLLDRVRDALRARHYSHRTEKAYVHRIRRYIFFHGKRHPLEMGAAEVTAFLTALALTRLAIAAVLLLLAIPLAAKAQSSDKVARVGVLWPGSSVPASPRMESLRQGLRESGYIEGQNLAIELRFSTDLERLRELATELVQAQVNVIVSFGDGAPRAAQQATTQVPIVAIADDIVGAGLVNNLARPGGNLTGITILAPELSAKRLELLKELRPRLSRVAALWDPTTPSQLKVAEGAAQSLGIRLQALPVRSRADLPRAFELAKKERAEAFNVLASPLLASLQPHILEHVTKTGLPAIYQWKEHTVAGGLMSYGPSLAAMWQQTGHVIAKILRGAKPSDLPVEQPAKFELVINLAAAKTLGLTIPASMRARADSTIE